MLFGAMPPLEEGERHVLVIQSHLWQPLRAALPLAFLLLSPLIYLVLDILLSTALLTVAFPIFLWCVVILFAVYLVKWVCFDLLPWSQRIYIVTDRRLIAQDGVLSVHRRECSLLKVEESDYTSRGVVSRLLNVGDVIVQTASQYGSVVLVAVQEPRRIQTLITVQARLFGDQEDQRMLAETPREIMRQLVAATGKAPPPYMAVTEPFHPVSPRQVRRQKRLHLLPDEEVVEVVRQHPVLLLVGLLGPSLATLFVIAVTLVFGPVLLPYAAAIIVLLFAPWAVYRLLAYLGHEYVLTTERLMELSSLPLAFDRRDIVQLSSIQDIVLEMPAVIGRLADVGDVVVESSGNAERVVLKTVAGPSMVQKTLFDTIDARDRHKHEKEDQRLASMLCLWFEEYNKLQQGT